MAMALNENENESESESVNDDGGRPGMAVRVVMARLMVDGLVLVILASEIGSVIVAVIGTMEDVSEIEIAIESRVGRESVIEDEIKVGQVLPRRALSCPWMIDMFDVVVHDPETLLWSTVVLENNPNPSSIFNKSCELEAFC